MALALSGDVQGAKDVQSEFVDQVHSTRRIGEWSVARKAHTTCDLGYAIDPRLAERE